MEMRAHKAAVLNTAAVNLIVIGLCLSLYEYLVRWAGGAGQAWFSGGIAVLMTGVVLGFLGTVHEPRTRRRAAR